MYRPKPATSPTRATGPGTAGKPSIAWWTKAPPRRASPISRCRQAKDRNRDARPRHRGDPRPGPRARLCARHPRRSRDVARRRCRRARQSRDRRHGPRRRRTRPVRHAARGSCPPSPRHRDRPQAARSSRRGPGAGDHAGNDRMTMRADLDHLPAAKRRELERVARVLFDEFEDAVKTKLSDKRKGGRILKLILFGSYARGDWVEDRASGYISDYDLLVVVNSETFTDLQTWWAVADDHLVRELTVTRHLSTPVNFIVHSLMDVNDQLARGRPFFADIARDGIALYEAPGQGLAKIGREHTSELQSLMRISYAVFCLKKKSTMS